MRVWRLAAALVCALASVASGALAQVQDPNIEQRLEQARPGPTLQVQLDEAILTGREDLVLLRERKLFSITGDIRESYTTNAFLTDRRVEDDFVTDAGLTFRVGTRIDQRFDVYAEGSVFGSRYAENEELDFNGLAGRAGVEMPIGDYRVGLAYQVTAAFDSDGFGDHLVTLHDIVLSANRIFVLDQDTALVPQVTVGRTFADPSDFELWFARGSVSLVHRFMPNLIGAIGPEIYYRAYDNYFENLTGESREDVGLRISAAIRWQPYDFLQVSAEASYVVNESTVGFNDYDAFGVAPMVRLTLRF